MEYLWGQRIALLGHTDDEKEPTLRKWLEGSDAETELIGDAVIDLNPLEGVDCEFPY
jgi:hypothetical protein